MRARPPGRPPVYPSVRQGALRARAPLCLAPRAPSAAVRLEQPRSSSWRHFEAARRRNGLDWLRKGRGGGGEEAIGCGGGGGGGEGGGSRRAAEREACRSRAAGGRGDSGNGKGSAPLPRLGAPRSIFQRGSLARARAWSRRPPSLACPGVLAGPGGRGAEGARGGGGPRRRPRAAAGAGRPGVTSAGAAAGRAPPPPPPRSPPRPAGFPLPAARGPGARGGALACRAARESGSPRRRRRRRGGQAGGQASESLGERGCSPTAVRRASGAGWLGRLCTVIPLTLEKFAVREKPWRRRRQCGSAFLFCFVFFSCSAR